ncbi:hypothetical protein FJ250_00955 [bacterium]|nr:hypothetical protein [bacterium]
MIRSRLHTSAPAAAALSGPGRRAGRPGFRSALALAALAWLAGLPGGAAAQTELTYQQYRDLARLADGFEHVAQFEPLAGEAGMFLAVGERFGTVQVLRSDGRGVRSVWKSNQLAGIPEEVIVADLSGDGLDDALLCRTNAARIYAWRLDEFSPLWESLSGEYAVVTCFAVANVDEDPAAEIVLVADNRLVYIDGGNFTKQFTSINEYSATRVRCGDVDGDGRAEIVLNSGKVVDAGSGDIEWEDEPFFGRIELLDIDGNGVLEVLTESPDGGALKVFDIGGRREIRFQ